MLPALPEKITSKTYWDDLDESERIARLPFWETVYKRAFPDFEFFEIIPKTNIELQFAGIDKIIFCSTRSYTVDEKNRYETYDDICLEYVSNSLEHKPKCYGWVCKELKCDYIVYNIMPTRTCYFLPVKELQAAWLENCTKWKDEYGIVKSEKHNKDYRSFSCPVPPDVLLQAVPGIKVVSWDLIRRKCK